MSLIDSLKQLLNLYSQLLKLELIDKSSGFISSFILIFIVLVFSGVILTFFSYGLVHLLHEKLAWSLTNSFFAVGGGQAVAFLIILLSRKKIKRKIRGVFIRKALKS